MVRLLCLFVFGVWCQLPVTSQAIEPATSVNFQIRNAGIIVTGSFSDLQTDIRFDPARLTESSLSASVDAASIRTGISLRDAYLKKRGYLDTEQYPRIQLVSKRIQKLPGNRYLGLFDLTIRGISQAVEFPFTYTPTGSTGRFVGQFRINRQNFSIGGGSLVLADDVDILLDVETPLKPF